MSVTSDDIEISLDDDAALQTSETGNSASKSNGNASKDGKKGAVPASDDDIQIIEASAGPKTATNSTERAAPAVLTPEDGLKKLQDQLVSEQRAREDAEKRAAAASAAEVAARTEVQGTQLDLVKNAITQFTSQNATLKSQYAQAAAAGDWDAAAEAQLGMSTNAAKLQHLENAKVQLEKAPKPTPTVAADQVEEYVSRIGSEFPRSREWLRSHSDFIRDEAKNAEMIAAHNLALARRLKPDTDAYFESIEKTLGLRTVEPPQEIQREDPTSSAAAPRSQRSAPPSAPVSRSGNGAAPRSNTITLSPDEREMARLQFPESKNPELEYARNKQALIREGKLN